MQSDLKIEPNKRIPQLDGLRGIAILMVMCYHFFPNNIICNFGWSGVDLFFVLSGFLITGRLYPYLNDKKILLKFYRNRFLRIVPLYFGFLIVFFVGWFVFVSEPVQLSTTFYSDYWWAFFLFIQNWISIFNEEKSLGYLSHLWSIAVKEQFYLLFPFLIIILRRPKNILVGCLLLILVVLICRIIFFAYSGQNYSYQFIYWNAFFRFDSF